MENTKRIYIIRHGESLQNRKGNPLSGVNETPLSKTGIDQCEYLNKYINRFRIKSVYTSPLERAVQTAKIIFPTNKPIIDEGLIEFDYGEYDGIVAANHLDDPVLSKWSTFPGNLTFPGGGNINDHAQSSLIALTRIVMCDDEDIIACVSHRTTIRLIISKILGLELDHFRKIPCSNCSITELDFVFPDKFTLLSLSISLKYLGLNT